MSEEQKRAMRKLVRRQLDDARKLMMRPLPAHTRAWLSGFAAEAQKTLEALR